MERSRFFRVGQLAVGAVALFGMASVAVAEPVPPSKQMYLKYCSACHGESGKGDGAVSHYLTVKATDLTQLARRDKGRFPFQTLVRVIDGRQSVRAHGDPEMPVWGDLFSAETPSTIERESQVRGRIMLIVEHIDSIQAD